MKIYSEDLKSRMVERLSGENAISAYELSGEVGIGQSKGGASSDGKRGRGSLAGGDDPDGVSLPVVWITWVGSARYLTHTRFI